MSLISDPTSGQQLCHTDSNIITKLCSQLPATDVNSLQATRPRTAFQPFYSEHPSSHMFANSIRTWQEEEKHETIAAGVVSVSCRSQTIQQIKFIKAKGPQGLLHCNIIQYKHYIKYTLQNLIKTTPVSDCLKANDVKLMVTFIRQ